VGGFGVDASANNILYADNVDFSGSVTQTRQITTDGQLLIGSTAAPNIKSGFLGSTDGSITWTTGSGTLTGQVTGGATVGKTITGNTGSPLSPVAGNWNIIGATLSAGTNASVTSGSGNTLTVTSINTAKWIVDPTVDRGTHQTIAAALAAASSGETIFIRPGTYTEDVTLKAGVNLSAFACDAATPNVTIAGNCSFASAGTLTISNIRLQTNSAAFLTVSGSAASIVNLQNCYLNCTNNTGISFTTSSASATIVLRNCNGDLGAIGIGLYSMSSTGTLNIQFSQMSNSGASVTASSNSAGLVQLSKSTLNIPFSTSSTGSINIFAGTTITTSATNTACLTMAGTGTGRSELCLYDSGTASAISIGVGCSYTVLSSTIRSSNTNPITGAGTINYAGLSFAGSSSNINTTTKNILSEGSSRTIGSANTGAANVLTINNTSNTATSSAQVAISTAGSTAADPTLLLTTTTTSWIMGVDNSVTVPTADTFVISQGSALGTNNIMSVATSGEINYPLQPSFLAYLATTATNKTGAGTAYTIGTDALTEVFDQNGDFNTNGTFTAPVTGKYQLNYHTRVVGCTIATTILLGINTNNRNYIYQTVRTASSGDLGASISVLADMDALDTATFSITVSGEAADTDDVAGGANANTAVSGFLQA